MQGKLSKEAIRQAFQGTGERSDHGLIVASVNKPIGKVELHLLPMVNETRFYVATIDGQLLTSEGGRPMMWQTLTEAALYLKL